MNSELFILAGDAGGTKTELELFKFAEGEQMSVFNRSYPSRNFRSLEEILIDFTSSFSFKADACCIGVPGPVSNGVSKATNLPWHIEEENLMKNSGIKNCLLANDLEIIAHSISYLSDIDLKCIHPGKGTTAAGNMAIIAPGTGLGQALIIKHNDARIVVTTEGGHADFAPQDELQIRLLKYLMKKFGHVSYERILSGPGICNIFDFLADEMAMKTDCDIEAKIAEDDKAKVISESAVNGTSEVCSQTMNIFVSVLGAHAGNIALTTNSSGGVYLGGGIPKKIIELIQSEIFEKAYLSKGRLSNYVMNCPVYVITHNNPGILGAARLAMQTFFNP
ncbi:MAG: glucokinase [Ignavibacteria bacterium]|nr:glucokinase [Ignavibacteria bacterium]